MRCVFYVRDIGDDHRYSQLKQQVVLNVMLKGIHLYSASLDLSRGELQGDCLK